VGDFAAAEASSPLHPFQLARQRVPQQLIGRADVINIVSNAISHIIIPAPDVMTLTLLWKFSRKLRYMP
jgi:hypothetical protein